MKTPGVKERVTTDSEGNIVSDRAVCSSACGRLGYVALDTLEMQFVRWNVRWARVAKHRLLKSGARFSLTTVSIAVWRFGRQRTANSVGIWTDTELIGCTVTRNKYERF